MLTRHSILLAIAISFSLAGCLDRPATEATGPSDNAPAKTAAESNVGSGTLFEYPVGGDASAFPLAPGSFISGSLPFHEGQPIAIAVQIGNYGNTSDGSLSVELCQKDRCSTGTASLTSSTDNAYLEIPISPALDTADTSPFRYRLVKVAGSKQVAVWLYTLPPKIESPKVNDQTALFRTSKLALRF